MKAIARRPLLWGIPLLLLAGSLTLSSQQALTPREAEMARLVVEVQAQQAETQKNHTAITAKLAAIEEELRQARIYASRSGKGSAQ